MFVRVHRVQPGEDHGLDLFKSGQRLDSGTFVIGDRVADFGVRHILEIGKEESNFPRAQFIHFDGFGSEDAKRLHFRHVPV